MRLLIVEDDRDLSAALTDGLVEEGFAVAWNASSSVRM